MTPAEARAKLLEHNFFSIWQGRHLIGGSDYKPGNPGSFEGIRFVISLVTPGAYTARVIDFGDRETELHPDVDIRDLSLGQTKDLEWAVTAVLAELGRQLDNVSVGMNHKVPLDAALEAAREHPDATNERELLTRLFLSADAEKRCREGLSALKYRVIEHEESLTEEALFAGSGNDLRVSWPQRGPLVTSLGEPKPIAAPSKNICSYGRNRSALSMGLPPEETRDLLTTERDFHWAPLAEKDSWPTLLRPIARFAELSTPREMSTVLFMSATRQVIEQAEHWLDLVFFTSEPVDGKLTACFLGSKADVTKRPKPPWLIELGNAYERELWAIV